MSRQIAKRKRKFAYWYFLFSNVLWAISGLHDRACALIAFQVALPALHIRGARKNDPASNSKPLRQFSPQRRRDAEETRRKPKELN